MAASSSWPRRKSRLTSAHRPTVLTHGCWLWKDCSTHTAAWRWSVRSVIERCFKNELALNGWLPRLKEIIPSYGHSLIADAALCRRLREETADALELEHV